jgi:hypothetical protein
MRGKTAIIVLKILGASVQNLLTHATQCAGFVYPCLSSYGTDNIVFTEGGLATVLVKNTSALLRLIH